MLIRKTGLSDPWTSKILVGITLALLHFTSSTASAQERDADQPPSFTLMGLGDSITEGGESFGSYLFPLWEKLFAAGYIIDFVGPKQSPSRIGPFHHAGYSGQTVEYLDKIIDSLYRRYPADIVLLHSGHNHFAEENPIDGIISAHKSIITKIKAINPDALIFVAQVIESGKLPKYSYLPELNDRIGQLETDLGNTFAGIYVVDQSAGFGWRKDTIEDRVHPNVRGAEKLAKAWFDAIQMHTKPTFQPFHPELVEYKLASTSLKLHVFHPSPQTGKTDPKPCIVFFFGGGWKLGTPLQFYREATHYANKGMVAVSADYRIEFTHGTTAFEAVEDAKAAIRWIREHASEYNIDPDRIAVAGASAGGHLAAATGTLSGFDDPNKNSLVSPLPNLNILYYPVLDNGPNGYGEKTLRERYRQISPLHNVAPHTPSTLILLGTKDPYLSEDQAIDYKGKLESFGKYCEIHLYEGAGHPIFPYRKGPSPAYFKMLEQTDAFLEKQGYLLQ